MKTTPDTFQDRLDDPVHGEGVSDAQAQRNIYLLEDIGIPTQAGKVKLLAYGGSGAIKQLAYGGANINRLASSTGSRIYRLERGYPKTRRGDLIPSVPRTKAETLYTKDTGQALQNKILNVGVSGVGSSGLPSPGTTNKINTTTGALNRYRTPYKTLIQ